MKFYTIYKTLNKIDNKVYYGFHETENPYDGYLGSGKYLKRAIKKYGIENFEKFVLYIFDNREDMIKKEAELIDEDKVKDKKIYNLKKGGQGGWDYVNKNGFAKSNEHLIIANKAKKNKYINTWNDFYKSIYKKSGLIEWKKSNDPEIKKRRSEIAKNAFLGKNHSDETKKRMSEKQKNINRTGKNNPMYGKCWIYNDKESIRINNDEIDLYLKQGWLKGRRYKF